MTGDPVTCALRVDSSNPGHVEVSMFVGRNEGARGHTGHLTFRADEWAEIVRQGVGGHGQPGKLVIAFDVLAPLIVQYQHGRMVAVDGVELAP